MRELGFHLRLVHARLQKFTDPLEAFAGQVARGFDGIDLVLRLHGTQRIHQRREAMIFVQRKRLLCVAHKTAVAGFHRHVGALMFVAVEENIFQFAHQRTEDDGKFRSPFYRLDAGNPRGLFLRELMAFPNFQMLTRLADKKDFPLRGIGGIRRDEENGLLLMDAGQMKEVSVLQMPHRTIGIRRHDVVGVQHGERTWRQQFDEALAIEREQRGWQRDSFHFRAV